MLPGIIHVGYKQSDSTGAHTCESESECYRYSLLTYMYMYWHNNELTKLGLRLHETDTPPRALAVGTPFDNTNMLYTAEPICPVHAVSDDELIGAAEADKVKLNINHASLDLVKKAARTN